MFLETAQKIGEHLADQALWNENLCTWEFERPGSMRPDPTAKPTTESENALSGIFQGTAGVAWFLAELHQHTEDRNIKQAANGAIRHALLSAEHMPENSFGFYAGRVGVSYVATKVGQYFDRPQYVNRAADLLTPLFGSPNEEENTIIKPPRTEIIRGCAGAIPALLHLSVWHDSGRLANLAFSLGESLIRRAFHEPVGWSWRRPDANRASRMRHLTGYSHGASGIGHALLELYAVSGAERYRYAAEQAFLYERQFFNQEISNWLDLRHLEARGLAIDDMDELKRRIREDEISPSEETYMATWCHGAPGIGLTRLRAYDLTGNNIHLSEAEAALKTTSSTLDLPSWNYSLCHGYAGNCETLLYGASVLEEPSLRKKAVSCGEFGETHIEDGAPSFPCGTNDGSPDPSLMIGKAGIGYFYLRLYSEETPSCLFLRAPDSLKGEGTDADGYEVLQRDYVETYFERTLSTLSAFEWKSPPDPKRSIEESMRQSDVENFSERLSEYLADLDEPDRSMLKDAARLDRTRHDMQKEITYYTEKSFRDLLRPDVENISWDSACFELATQTEIVDQRWDWDDWLTTSLTERPEIPEKSRSAYLFYRTDKKIRVREIGSFTELVLRSLETPASVPQVAETIQDQADLDGVSHEILRQKIIAQLSEVYEAGAIHLLETAEAM